MPGESPGILFLLIFMDKVLVEYFIRMSNVNEINIFDNMFLELGYRYINGLIFKLLVYFI